MQSTTIEPREQLSTLINQVFDAESAARRWLRENESLSPETILGELRDPFLSDRLRFVSGRLTTAGAVLERLRAVLRSALDELAARPVEAASDSTPSTVAELEAAQQQAEAAEVVAAARRALADSADATARVEPLLAMGVTAFAEVWLTTYRAFLLARHEGDHAAIRGRLQRQREEWDGLRALAEVWAVAVKAPEPLVLRHASPRA